MKAKIEYNYSKPCNTCGKDRTPTDRIFSYDDRVCSNCRNGKFMTNVMRSSR